MNFILWMVNRVGQKSSFVAPSPHPRTLSYISYTVGPYIENALVTIVEIDSEYTVVQLSYKCCMSSGKFVADKIVSLSKYHECKLHPTVIKIECCLSVQYCKYTCQYVSCISCCHIWQRKLLVYSKGCKQAIHPC